MGGLFGLYALVSNGNTFWIEWELTENFLHSKIITGVICETMKSHSFFH